MENYKERYEKALERAKQFYNANTNKGYRKIFEDIFEELRESEDEKIIKALIHYFSEQDGILTAINGSVSVRDILAWLEKQGDHANFRNKIQIGDKVTRNEDGVLVNLSQLDRVAEPAEKQRKKRPVELSEICNYLECQKREESSRKNILDKWIAFLKSLNIEEAATEGAIAQINRILNVLDWAEEKGRISYSDWEDCYEIVASLKYRLKK